MLIVKIVVAKLAAHLHDKFQSLSS